MVDLLPEDYDEVEEPRVVVIPEFKMILHPLSEEAKELRGINLDSKNICNESKLGGYPECITSEVWPNCPECGIKMSFYAQLAPVSPDYPICSNSTVYVFLCFDCYESFSIIQKVKNSSKAA